MFGIARSCLLAALFSFVAGILKMTAVIQHHNKANMHESPSQFKELDPELIQEDWKLRRDMRPLETAAGLFNAVTWIMFCIPMLQVLYHLSMGGRHLISLHATLAVLIITGAISEFVTFVMFVGATTSMEWIATDFNLDYWLDSPPAGETGIGWSTGNGDGIGWRTLEIVYISIHGMLLWIGAMEWLFMVFIMFLFFVSISRQVVVLDDQGVSSSGKISSGFGTYCMLLSLISLAQFVFELLRYKEWRTFTRVLLYVSFVASMLLWPVWFLWLGRHAACLAPSRDITMHYDPNSFINPSSSADDPQQMTYSSTPSPFLFTDNPTSAGPSSSALSPEPEETPENTPKDPLEPVFRSSPRPTFLD